MESKSEKHSIHKEMQLLLETFSCKYWLIPKFFKHLISAFIYACVCICINILKCVYQAQFSREIEPTWCAGGGDGRECVCIEKERF